MKLLTIAAIALTALSATGARADESPGRTLLRQGIALRREGRDAEALEAFVEANRVEPSAVALAQIGLAEEALGRWLLGETALESALAQANAPWIDRHREELEHALAEVRTHVGSLRVETPAPAAQLVIDGVAAPAEEPRQVQEGPVSFVVRAPGYRSAEGTADIVGGSMTRVPISLEEEPAVDAPEPSPRAEDHAVAPAPAPRAPAPPSAGRPAPIREKRSPWEVPAPLFAGGALAIGAGAWAGLRALAEAKTRDARCSARYCDAAGLQADAQARTWSSVSTASFTIGATAALAGGIWLALGSRRPSGVAWSVGPGLGASLGGSL